MKYTAEQVHAILNRTDQLIARGRRGWNPLSGMVPERTTYTRHQVTHPLNIAANAIQGSHQYESSNSIQSDDRANLSVNITDWLLDHLDRVDDATIEEIITDQYSTDPEDVLGWVS